MPRSHRGIDTEPPCCCISRWHILRLQLYDRYQEEYWKAIVLALENGARAGFKGILGFGFRVSGPKGLGIGSAASTKGLAGLRYRVPSSQTLSIYKYFTFSLKARSTARAV